MKAQVETSYHPGRECPYHIESVNRASVKLPRRRWFATFEELTGAVMALNPGVEFVGWEPNV